MKVLMHPHVENFKTEESGIRRVVENYFKYLPDFGIELVGPKDNNFDALAIHVAGNQSRLSPVPVIQHCHGLYWTADYPADAWQWRTNLWVVDTTRAATMVTVPSNWVAETFTRDLRIRPEVVPHGIDLDEWGDPTDHGGYILWNKNRAADVCDPFPVISLARRFPHGSFITTVLPPGAARPTNVKEIGLQDYQTMKGLVKGALVYLATTKETFGIGILEAMASGVPTLGFNHGGITDLIEHGVTGYLARPGDYEDLANGALYCIQHRQVLGDNAREAVKVWTWEKAAEQVAGVYRQAAENDAQPYDVSVVIPCYNYGDKVGRAIESVCNQTFPPKEIVVVDDGSDDQHANMTHSACVHWESFSEIPIRYVIKDNGGVATARNVGVQEASGRLIACLDADDAMAPEFLSYCQRAFLEDRALGIAYTGILAVDKDGNQEVSKWPPEFNYGDQLNRYNQIPTCCVYKKEMWERLGGYRQRYAPGGAGAEDAEFWLRAGAYGFDAKKVTAKPLFIYSLGTGRVSGDPEYKEVDWTSGHPWVRDGMHPFGSIADSKGKFSHPVRQYDNPLVSVIIPVGEGHHETLIDALDSLEAQTFRNWEVIVVWDSIPPADFINMYTKAYPYVNNRVSYNKVSGSAGAGAARNLGASVARGAFFVFLDADDRLYPEGLEAYLESWSVNKGITYSDYVGRTFVSEDYMQEAEREGRLLNYNPKTGASIIAYKSADYDCELAQRQPEYSGDPNMPFYHWCLVTCLIPRELHFAIDGFDENMDSWEDVDYHWRMAHQGVCYYHLQRELVVYQFHTGARRERGLQSHADLVQYMQGKYQGGSKMACNKCPGGQGASPQPRQNSPFGKSAARSGPVHQAPVDNDFIWALYQSPNRGDHRVIGVTAFQYRIDGLNMIFRNGHWFIDYNYLAGGSGEPILVHRRDVDQMPNFVPQAQTIQPQQAAVPLTSAPPVRAPQRPPAPAQAPAPAPAKSHVDVKDTAAIPDEWLSEMDGPTVGEIIDEGRDKIDFEPTKPEAPEVDMSSVMGPRVEDVQPDPDAAPVLDEVPPFNWQVVPGVGSELAEQLFADGYISPRQLLDSDPLKYLMGFDGIGAVKAGRIITATESFLRRQEALQAQAEQEAANSDGD